MRTGRRIVIRVGLAALGRRVHHRIVQGLRGPAMDVAGGGVAARAAAASAVVTGAAGVVTATAAVAVTAVQRRRRRAGDAFADDAERHHVRARYEHGDHDRGRGAGEPDDGAQVGPAGGERDVRGAPAQPDGQRRVGGDGEARALAVVAPGPVGERRDGAQQRQQDGVVGQGGQEQGAADEPPAQVGGGGQHGELDAGELDGQGQLHGGREREHRGLHVPVDVAHEARVGGVARRDHGAPGQHGGEHQRATGARPEHLGVAHGLRVRGAVHGERHGAAVRQQRAGHQHERVRRVALQHVLLAHADHDERADARGAQRAHRAHRQRGRDPHVLFPRHQRHGLRRIRGLRRRRRRRRHASRTRVARGQRVRRLRAGVLQPSRAVRALHVRADRIAAAAVFGDVHQRDVILAAVQQRQPVQNAAERLGAVFDGDGCGGRRRRRRRPFAARGHRGRGHRRRRVPAVAVGRPAAGVRVQRAQHVRGRLHELRGDGLFRDSAGSRVPRRTAAVRLEHVRPVLELCKTRTHYSGGSRRKFVGVE